MSVLDNRKHILNDFSNLLVRSPSCSCVLNDLLENIMTNWHGSLAAVLIKDYHEKLRPLAWIDNTGQELKRNFAAKDFVESFRGFATVKKCTIKDNMIKLHEDGELFIVTSPLWIGSKIAGILALGSSTEYLPTDDDMSNLQIITNQVSLSLEKELATEKNNSLKYCFNSVLDSLTEGIAIINGNKISYVNSLIKAMLNTSVDVNNSLNDLFNSIINISKEPLKAQIYLETCRTVERECYSFEIETKDGKYLKFTKFHILAPGNELLSFGFLVSDITKHKETDKLKNDLLAIVSHELRTPLTSIKGNVSSLLRKDVIWDKEMQENFLNDIYDECNRLNLLIDKLLDISKITGGVLKLDKELITIDKFVNRFNMKIVSKVFQGRNIQFDIKNGKDVIDLDEEKIQQVLVNLIDNGIKYGPPHVKIKISVTKEDDMALFAVKDNGPGIPQNVLEKVFQKFYQANYTRGDNLGSGLGLAICKGFVQAHGGTIWARSTIGKGSTFYFTLPLKEGRE